MFSFLLHSDCERFHYYTEQNVYTTLRKHFISLFFTKYKYYVCSAFVKAAYSMGGPYSFRPFNCAEEQQLLQSVVLVVVRGMHYVFKYVFHCTQIFDI